MTPESIRKGNIGVTDCDALGTHSKVHLKESLSTPWSKRQRLKCVMNSCYSNRSTLDNV